MIASQMDIHHTPVLVNEVVQGLNVRPSGKYVDCTAGEGGHAQAIFESAHSGVRLLGIDLDPQALQTARQRLEPFGDSCVLVEGAFSDLEDIASSHGFRPVDGILWDLGLSSLQLEVSGRGFTFQGEEPLDMRFSPRQGRTAADVVNRYPLEKLGQVIATYGEEPRAWAIARAIVRSRPIHTTFELSHLIENVVGRRGHRIHPATRTFQALRMEVNSELDNIRTALEQGVRLLAPTGRLVVISYHSLEDRLVKTFFHRESIQCLCPPRTPQCICGHQPTLRVITRKVITPSREETRLNPRSRSARMRIAERL